MPHRIIKEGICANEQIDRLTAFEETFFYRLIVNVDDYGLMDGRVSVLKAKLFTLRCGTMKDSEVEKALKRLCEEGLVEVYHCKGRPYLHLTGWERNQQIRAKKPKYPRPEEADEELPEINCNQAQAGECTSKQAETHDGRENQPSADDPVVVEMVLNDGGTYKVTRSEAERYQALYPAVDVVQELRNAAGWLEGNPTRRKTKAGIKRYINGWLAREQDNGKGKGGSSTSYAPPSNRPTGGNPFKR